MGQKQGNDARAGTWSKDKAWRVGETALVAALSAVLGGVLAAHMAATADAQAERRAQVAEHYAGYLDAANAYYAASQSFVGTAGSLNLQDEQEAISVLQPVLERLQQAETDYRTAANNVYAFGSEDAWSAHQLVLATLPDAFGYNQARDVNPADVDEFTAAHNAFLEVFCQEAVAEPRDNCGDN